MKKSSPNQSSINPQPKINRTKNTLFFILIMILIPILILIGTEYGLRKFNYGYDLRLFTKSSLYPGYYEINHKVGKRYFTKFNATEPTNDIFLINKPDTCYRIFVMGCSTTRGFPYQSGTTFSRILNYRLQDVFPRKRIEVVNISMSAVNSYTMADVIDEIMSEKPDAVLIYTGHNEYYGALGIGSVENGGNVRWLKKLNLKLIRLRTYQLVQNLIGRLTRAIAGEPIEKGTLMERIVRDKYIEFGSKKYYAGIEQFRDNMSEVTEKVKKSGTPLILSELVCNVRDQYPFKSIKTNKNPGADELFEKARMLESQGKFKEARGLYYQAKDYDAIRFRAPEAFNTVIHELGKKFNVPVIPMETIFEDKSPHGIIGDNLMLEHLHPNLDGYFLMADAFFNAMREEKLISASWDNSLIKPSDYYRHNWGFTSLDSLIGDIKIKMIKNGWPFKPDTFINNIRETYKPVSYVDSVAFHCVCYETHIEDEHISLAKYYASIGDFSDGYKEYYSLVKSYPFVSSLYLDAIDYLVPTKDYRKIIDLLLSMPDYNRNYIAMYNLGTSFLMLKNADKAIAYFNQARTIISPNDSLKTLLIQFYKAYRLSGNKEKEEEIITEIKTLDPSFNMEPIKPEKVKIEVPTLEKQITDAIQLIQARKVDEALQVLYGTLKVKETLIACKMIGSILFFRKDLNALTYYEKAYDMKPTDPEVLNNLFILYLIKKDFAKAAKCLEEFKRVSTDYDKTQRLNKMLERATNAKN